MYASVACPGLGRTLTAVQLRLRAKQRSSAKCCVPTVCLRRRCAKWTAGPAHTVRTRSIIVLNEAGRASALPASPPTLWRAVIPGRGSDSSLDLAALPRAVVPRVNALGTSNGRRTAQREHKLPPRGRDAPLDLWRGKSGHPTDPARAFGHGLGEPCGVATYSSSGGCRPSSGRPRRHRCRAPYVRRTPRTQSWPCTRTLGIGENPSAVGTDSSRHAETLLICHWRDVNNVLTLRIQETGSLLMEQNLIFQMPPEMDL